MSARFSDEVLKRAYVACDYALLSSVATDWADGLAAMRAVLEEHLAETPLYPHWRCDTHGIFDARVAVGCPECVRTMRDALKGAASDGSPR